MSLKPMISAGLSQQTRMTPQLQQAIRLLQLSSAELTQEIQQMLDSNIMLELVEPDLLDGEDEAEQPITASAGEHDEAGAADDNIQDSERFSDVSFVGEGLPDGSVPGENLLETRNAEHESLQTHLEEQITLLNLSEQDLYIAWAIVEGVDAEGMLTVTLEDILQAAPAEWELAMEEVEAMLHLVQHLDPTGVASRSLSECLVIQLQQLPDDTPWRSEAIKLVTDCQLLLSRHDYRKLERQLGLKEAQLREVISLIQTMHPKPIAGLSADIFGAEGIDYVEPDLIASKRPGKKGGEGGEGGEGEKGEGGKKGEKGEWVVELNPSSTPRLAINEGYASLIKRGGQDQEKLRDLMQEAKWFLNSLQQRNDTLLKVAQTIVTYQQAFLEQGEAAMKPMVMLDIAAAVGLHESTISRVTTQKYLATPRGMFELKYFFSSRMSGGAARSIPGDPAEKTDDDVSSIAVKAKIRELVAQESPRKPLSDNRIAKLLAAQGMKVARRTIAKYREQLLIPPSNERKRL